MFQCRNPVVHHLPPVTPGAPQMYPGGCRRLPPADLRHLGPTWVGPTPLAWPTSAPYSLQWQPPSRTSRHLPRGF